VEEKLGAKFIQFRMQPFEKSYEETSASTPVFFILSPGVDPLKVDLIFYISINIDLTLTAYSSTQFYRVILNIPIKF